MAGTPYSTKLSGGNGIAPIPEGLQVGLFQLPGPWQHPAAPVPQASAGPKGILPDVPTVLVPKQVVGKFAPAPNYDPNTTF